MASTTLTKETLREQLQLAIGDDLAAVNQVLLNQFRNPNEFVAEVCEHVARFQGKRIRPILVLLSSRLCSEPQKPTDKTRELSQKLAAVVELIHTATLVHDDVIDDADLRRHVSTVHRRWNTQTSVLLGDYLFSKAFHLAATTGDAEACRLIGRATDRTCEGELNQIAAGMEQSTSERDYFRVIAGKTGQLFAVSCLLGARSGGATAAQQSQLRQFGLRLGLAFQIADDVLDLTESSETTGKDEANDLQNGRMTLPLIRSLRLADESQRTELLEILASDSPGIRTRLATLEIVRQGTDSARTTAEQLIRRATENLQRLPECPERSLMEAIATFAVHRSH
ncbi:MAG: polyprenyl synthetase family protein [Planctomycetaceae bacterium]|nr:polyprenyl synthetase family protein [Planctomycetaceae bacterium]